MSSNALPNPISVAKVIEQSSNEQAKNNHPLGWFAFLDADHNKPSKESLEALPNKVVASRILPFAFMHTGCLLVLLCGFSWPALVLCIALYFIRMFSMCGFYHRYFSHRTFKTYRWVQFIFAVWGLTAIQKGPLWWAAKHRHHHRYSDMPNDIHSAKQEGFFWSHIGWIMTPKHLHTYYDEIPDFAKFPELVFLNRFDWIVPLLFGVALYGFGFLLQAWLPNSGITPFQTFVWGWFVSTVILYHGTFTINSLSHVFGNRRFETTDTSKNNWFLAIVTLGEGWHNNHHHYCGSVRQGFYWWEYDITYYVLKVFQMLGLIYDLNPVPQKVYEQAKQH